MDTIMFTHIFVKRAFTRTIRICHIKNSRNRLISTTVRDDSDINFRNGLRNSLEDIQKTMVVACKLRPESLTTDTSFSESEPVDPLSFLNYGDLQHVNEYGIPSSDHLLNISPDSHVSTSLKNLFTDGIQCLLNYCDHNHTHDTTIFPLIFDFLRFWKHKDNDEASLKTILKTFNPVSGNRVTEKDIYSILAVHLLSPLVDVQYPKLPYIVSSKNVWKKRDLCPCGVKKCRKQVIYGSTLIGNRELFYGKPDVIVFPHEGAVGIIFEPSSGCQQLKEENSEQFEERPLIQRPPVRSISQIVRQTIIFSYYQKGHILRNSDMENQSVTLIPTIVINPAGFDVYMYDSKYDIFLKAFNQPFPIWDEDYKLNMSSIVLLWMMLNHVTFRPKLNKTGHSLLRHSFGFQKGDVDEDKRALDVTMWNVLPNVPRPTPVNPDSYDVVDYMDAYPELCVQ